MRLGLHLATNLEEPRLKPVDKFRSCPACGCDELIYLDPDVLCTQCDWNSAAWDVSRGAMDSLLSAAKEFGGPRPSLLSHKTQRLTANNDELTIVQSEGA